MKNKTLAGLGIVAAVLAVAAYFAGVGSKGTSPRLNGKSVFPGLDLSRIASVEVGGKALLVSGEKSWKVMPLHGYPADRAKIAENFIKLSELKVGQVVRGRDAGAEVKLEMKDGEGKTVASLTLGDKHAKWGYGRYAKFEGETVLVSDALEQYDGDGKAWVETKIVDTPYITFNTVVDPATDNSLFGFSTGVVAKVTVGTDTNRVVTIGNELSGGSDRYLKLDGSDWVYTVSKYSVESLLPKPPEKKKDEAKKDDVKKDEVKKEGEKKKARAEAAK